MPESNLSEPGCTEAAMKIVVIGGSGLIGKKLVKVLRERGHEVVAASPSSGVNAVTGEGPRLGPTRFEDWLTRTTTRK
jgi:nucleoside-diphosphate-sugar epimerase